MGTEDGKVGPAWLRSPFVWKLYAVAAGIWLALGVTNLVIGRYLGLLHLALGVSFGLLAFLARRTPQADRRRQVRDGHRAD